MTLKDAIALTSVGEDSFLQDPPNAVLTMMDGEEPIDVVFVLDETSVKGDEVILKVRVLDGKLPAKSGRCALFIDAIGFHGGPGPGPRAPMNPRGPADPRGPLDPRGPVDPRGPGR